MTTRPPPSGPGHNGGPPLDDEHVPEWGRGGKASVYFAWKRAHAEVWRTVSWDTMLRRQRRADAIGLTYEEYTLEILERGRYLGPAHAERIEAIKAARQPPVLVVDDARPTPRRRPAKGPLPRPVPLGIAPRVKSR